jgi:hypothetical protein
MVFRARSQSFYKMGHQNDIQIPLSPTPPLSCLNTIPSGDQTIFFKTPVKVFNSVKYGLALYTW